MKKIVLFLFASLIVYATFFTEKERLDREVKRLCAIDGGIKVYETVKLPAERFDQYGQIFILSIAVTVPIRLPRRPAKTQLAMKFNWVPVSPQAICVFLHWRTAVC